MTQTALPQHHSLRKYWGKHWSLQPTESRVMIRVMIKSVGGPHVIFQWQIELRHSDIWEWLF